jgi:alpha-tubulin suppressor-like RCC1 family protein
VRQQRRRGPWTSIATNGRTFCAIDAAGALWCWGTDSEGQLGDGKTTDDPTPKKVPASGTWKQVAVGNSDVCGLQSDGGLWCWGSAQIGIAGIAPDAGTLITAPVRVGTDTWTQVVLGWDDFACARKTSGALACWGRNSDGTLGNGTAGASVPSPTVVGTDTDWTQVTAGAYHVCGLKSGGSVWCWGGNDAGQLGDGTTTSRLVPMKVADSGYAAIDARAAGTCGTKTDGSIACWGLNYDGQAGAPAPWSAVPLTVTLP